MFSATKSGVGSTAAPVTTDPYFNYTALLLNDTGTNGAQNNTFIDSSTNNFSITRNGNTTQGSFNPYEPTGYWGGYFDGNGDYLSIPSNTAFAMGTGDFTIECWFYIAGNSPLNGSSLRVATIFSNLIVSTAGYELHIIGNSTTTGTGINFINHTGSIAYFLTYNGTIPQAVWQHLAIVRSGTTTSMYLNGVSVASVVLGYQTINSVAPLWVGRQNYPSYNQDFNGYISNLRFVKGTAVYTGNFTVPTTPLTAITNTSLLCLQDNRFKDNSSNNFTITRNGDTRVTGFNPFAPTASYTTSAYGGSAYFDGTGDYLSFPATNTAFALGTGSFTFECWMYSSTFTTEQTLLDLRGSATNSLLVAVNASKFPFIWREGTGSILITSSVAITPSTWNHIAFVRNGTTLTVYVNGVSGGSITDSTNWLASSSTGRVGSNYTNANYINGYITDSRLVKGTAVYTAAFTPPTAPLTAISGTSLLLNATNAGIYDATTLNDMETVGNAQVSTTQAKWGASSMAFDGTGDWLLVPHNQDLMLGTGNFTVEGWVYLSATGAARGIVGKGTSTTGWLLSTNSSNNVVFTYGTSTITSTGTLSGSTWYHVAVVREGTGTNQTKIYINGTNDGTGTVSTNFNQTNNMYVGADRTAGSALNGYIEDLRITKGIARYTSNFTAPTAAFPTR